MIEQISWSFTIPTVIILGLIALIVWLVQDRQTIIKTLKAKKAYVERDRQGDGDAEDNAYYDGIIEGLDTAIQIFEGGAKNA